MQMKPLNRVAFVFLCVHCRARTKQCTQNNNVAVTASFASYAEGHPGKDKRSESIPVAPQQRKAKQRKILIFNENRDFLFSPKTQKVWLLITFSLLASSLIPRL